jgi:acetoin utilization protein AcuB
MLRVGDIMSTAVETVQAGESAEKAHGRMREQDVHHLVVVDDVRVVGVISERDLGGRGGASLRRDRAVDDLMTSRVVTAKPDSTLREAAKLLRGRTIGCLPVLDGHKLVGIITLSDVLDTIIRGVERPTPTGRRRSLRTELGRWRGAPAQTTRKRG